MVNELRKEGLKEVQYLVVTYPGVKWGEHVEGYNEVDIPVMPDPAGKVFETYSSQPYNAYLVDKKGRLVFKDASFDNTDIPGFSKRIRKLYVE